MAGRRSAGIAFWTGLAAAAVALVAAYGSGFGLWPFTIGFIGIAVALLLGLLAIVAAAVALVRGRGPTRGRALIGALAALGLLGVLGYWVDRGRGAPPIHDVTTDLAAPPQFEALSARADSLAVQGGAERWRQLHRDAYADIQPVVVPQAPALVIERAAGLVRDRGWAIASQSPTRIEATDTVSPFRFKDDVVIVATPVAGGTRVDMRSVSRVGVGDVGVNAARVRAFLAELKQS